MKQLNTAQRQALILAGALTVFALVLIGAVMNKVTQVAALPVATATIAVPPTAVPTPGPDPAVQALIDQREAAYQQQLKDANDRLAEANTRLKQAYAQAAAAAAAPAQPAAPPRPTYLTPERAASLALVVAQGANVTQVPGLVNFQGTAAYEVVLDRGSIYVDAVSGQVLYNGTAVAAVSGGGGGGGGGEHEGGHEGGGHDD